MVILIISLEIQLVKPPCFVGTKALQVAIRGLETPGFLRCQGFEMERTLMITFQAFTGGWLAAWPPQRTGYPENIVH
jgi:hypothetical protein